MYQHISGYKKEVTHARYYLQSTVRTRASFPASLVGSLSYQIVPATAPDPANPSRPERTVSQALLLRPHDIPADAIIADVLSTHMDLKRPGSQHVPFLWRAKPSLVHLLNLPRLPG